MIFSSPNRPKRFFSARLLKEHLEIAQKRYTCPACQKHISRKGLRRHWYTMHKDIRFPPLNQENKRHSTGVRNTTMPWSVSHILISYH
ncbi:hypothetical protein CPB86DRAFT_781968 [Serendipita vermifera]|nr:hypothetical protein CPB86DRAFT_781968 [Serendipita vermifera]